MAKIDIENSIIERYQYPVGKVDFEQEYLSAKVKDEKDFVELVLPYTFFHSQDKNFKILRDFLFNNWKVKAVIDLSSIWAPITSLRFAYLFLDKIQTDKVLFSKYIPRIQPLKSYNNYESKEMKFDEHYQNYLRITEKWLELGAFPESISQYVFIEVPMTEIDCDRLFFERHDPQIFQIKELISKENILPLEDLAEIINTNSSGKRPEKGYVLKVVNFTYPIDYERIVESDKNISGVKLKKGDIILFLTANAPKLYLIYEEPPIPLYASLNSLIIRLRDQLLSPEYLILYFNSDTIKQYLAYFQIGAVLKRISLKDLKSFPIIIPEKRVLDNATGVFNQLFLQKENKLQEINNLIFNGSSNITDKQIQKDFILEGIERLKVFKVEILDKLIKSDLNELERCLENKIYKSCLVLCGSILEAVLLDWLSEIENRDYYSGSDDRIELIEIIKRLSGYKCLDYDTSTKAHLIRKQRNLIHPRVYFASQSKIDFQLCKEMIESLKSVLRKRGIRGEK